MPTMTAPTLTFDPFGTNDPDERLDQYRELRAAGPVVFLESTETYAVGRYDEVKATLGDDVTFISGEGVAFTDFANSVVKGSTLGSDAPEHDHLRSVVATGLQPRAVRSRAGEVGEIARRIVDAATAKGEIDAVADLARAMPIAVVPDVLGLPERNRDELYDWAAGGIDLLGPVNERTPRNVEMSGCLTQFASELIANREFAPGSLGDRVLDAAEQGVITPAKCQVLMNDYLGPSMDTTAAAIGHLVVAFARRPDQWTALQSEPGLVTSAINEVLRHQSPLRGFTRLVARDTEVGGTTLPAGSRIWTVVAAANRDERHYPDPDRFDFRRNPIDHLAFGYGAHGCAGQGVARMELHALIHSLIDTVTRFELIGDPVTAENSMMNAWSSIPVRLVSKEA